MMTIDLSKLPEWAKLEVSKADLEAFAQTLIAESVAKTATPSVSENKIMTIEDLVAYINTARQTIYGWTSKGKIPYHKTPNGRKLYFVQLEIDEWLTVNKRI